VLRDVAQRFANDADDRALDDRVELAWLTALLHLHLKAGLASQIVDQAPEGDRKIQTARLALSKRGHVLPHVHESRPRVAGCFRELRSEKRGILVESALAAFEREHDTGELLRETIVQLLRDLAPLG
jgi:hypothetical protein